MLVTMKPILEASRASFEKGRPFGVGAFGLMNMEQFQGILEAASAAASPLIVLVSAMGLDYYGGRYLRNIVQAGAADHPEVPIALHFDHGRTIEEIRSAVGFGFTSVMIDGSLLEDSRTPAPFEHNVLLTAQAAEYAHAHGVSVEGELGVIGGIEDEHGADRSGCTDPDQAVEFVERTKIDALALSIGTAHGAFKFKGKPRIAFNIIEKVRRHLPKTYLVAHGSSSVPPEYVETINRYGGRIEQAAGVPADALGGMISSGINKINVDTDIQLVVTATLRQYLAEHPEMVRPRDCFKTARAAITKEIIRRMELFGSAGKTALVIA